jgi:1-acyl-sn-glycerol-3-phosphate acyltransferase
VALCGTERIIPKGSRSIRGGRIDVHIGAALPAAADAVELRERSSRWIVAAVRELERPPAPDAARETAGQLG